MHMLLQPQETTVRALLQPQETTMHMLLQPQETTTRMLLQPQETTVHALLQPQETTTMPVQPANIRVCPVRFSPWSMQFVHGTPVAESRDSSPE